MELGHFCLKATEYGGLYDALKRWEWNGSGVQWRASGIKHQAKICSVMWGAQCRISVNRVSVFGRQQ